MINTELKLNYKNKKNTPKNNTIEKQKKYKNFNQP